MYNYRNYRRVDYTPLKDQQDKPIEVAMRMFVGWAKRNNRNYFGSLVKENLSRELANGSTPEQAVANLTKRAP